MEKQHSFNIVLQATVYILDKLDTVLIKSPADEIRSEVLPFVFISLESNSLQAQVGTMAVAISGRDRPGKQVLSNLQGGFQAECFCFGVFFWWGRGASGGYF